MDVKIANLICARHVVVQGVYEAGQDNLNEVHTVTVDNEAMHRVIHKTNMKEIIQNRQKIYHENKQTNKNNLISIVNPHHGVNEIPGCRNIHLITPLSAEIISDVFGV